VLEMLEEEDGDLEMPNKPYLYAQDLPAEDVIDDSTSGSWSSNVH
ncbi:receptor-like kinase, partial [Trifolium medium]|nr:receptor-like kinase [Trifolium medium]